MIQPRPSDLPIFSDMGYYRDRVLVALAVAVCLVAPARATAIEPESAPLRVTLRADWSTSSDAADGAIELAGGRIISSRMLLLGDDACRIVAREEDRLRFRAAGPMSWGGLSFEVEATPTATITVRVGGDQLVSKLSELLDGSSVRASGTGSVRLRRDAADVLRVHIDRQHLVFAPGEEVRVGVEFNLLAERPRAVSTRWSLELRLARSGERLLFRQADLQLETNADVPPRRGLDVRMPKNQGVYDLALRVEPSGMKAVERTVQFVVVDERAPVSRPAELVTRLVEEIDPAHPEIQGAWYSRRRLMARTSRLGQFLWRSVRHPFGSPESGPESPVIATRLKIDNVGRPHVLSIDYDPNVTALLTASINEQDGDGRWIALPQSGGIKLTDKLPGPAVQSHQLVFWPRTNSPDLSLYVVGSGGLSAVKKIRVLELPQGFPSLELREPDGPKRLLGLSLDSSEAWSAWGSSRAVDAATGLVVEDWQTFLASAEHVAEYVRFAGFNCILAPAVSRGSALYPTDLLDANFRLDSGSLVESAPDPMRKDVIEMLLRVCERERVGLVPSLRLEGAITALEAKLSATDPRETGIALVSRDGTTWEQQSPSRARRYNPLSADVQSAILEVVREFAARYAARPGFEALALDLGPQTHLVLPGADWCYDDATVERFLRDTELDVLPRTDRDVDRFARRHQVLSGPAREQWVAWRGRQVAALYQAILTELHRTKPGARLVLNLTTFIGSGGEDLRDAFRSGRSVEEALRGRGLDLRNLAAPRDVIMLRPFMASGATAEAQQLNSNRELDELTSKLSSRGTICLQEPEVLYLSGDGQKPDDARSETVAAPLSAPGRSNLRWRAHSLSAADCQAYFEGGPAVAFGQEQYQREFARVFRSLPAAEFRAVETLQPVAVRSYHDQSDTHLYLVNDASYSVETSLAFTCSAKAQLTNASSGEKLTTQPTEQGVATKLTLEAYQTVALRLSGPAATLSPCSVKVPLAAEKGLKVRFDRLTQAMLILGRDGSRTLDGLPPNGDFETATDDGETPLRWSACGDSAACALDRAVFHRGNSALRLTGASADGVVSGPFAPPAGAAISLNVWLRADRPGLKIRWFLEGTHGDETIYRCYADVPVHTNWEQKQFRARALPDGQLTDVQIRFQLLGEGSLWVDDAEICALPISKDEQRAINKSVSAIVKAWKDRRLSDFERMADGYWATYLIESVEGSHDQPDKPTGTPPPM